MSTATAPHPLSTKFQELRSELNEIFLERKDAIEAMLLAVLAGEHVFMLGPPGTAKSQMVRALVDNISGARYFETLLSKHRPPEAVFGPLDIKEFRDNGNYFLKRAGYATACEFIFADEIGKASAILGHDMLALFNERIYHETNGGRSVHPAPLSTAFTASNELITDESDEGAALWDRLLFRVIVDYLKDDDNFQKLITSDMPAPETKVDWAELQAAIKFDVPAVVLSDGARTALGSLRNALARENIYPSDRRWRQSVKALKAHAFLAGRDTVKDSDIMALRFTLWDTVNQVERVERLCKEAANPYAATLLEIADAISEIRTNMAEREEESIEIKGRYAHEAIRKLRTANDELKTLAMEAGAEGEVPDDYEKTVDQIRTTVKTIANKLLDLDPEAAEDLTTRQLGEK